jgi:hypothetical protein
MKNNPDIGSTLTPMSLESAKVLAPAIFATAPASYINRKRYHFTPTTEVIDFMSNLGWQLTNAKQSSTKKDLRRYFGTHIVEFQHPELMIKNSDSKIEARPTVLLLNSHDGSRPINFEMGLFRLVCSNGLVIKDRDFGGFKERHTKYDFQGIKNLIDEKVTGLNEIVKKINTWNQVELKPIDRRKFAEDAIKLRTKSDRIADDYEVIEILSPRRDADASHSLWHVFNRVQENLIKGGYQMNNRTARAITNPIADMEINQGLWQIAEEYAS